LGKPEIIADGEREAAARRVEDGNAEIARLEDEPLLRPKVILAVAAGNVAVRPDEHGRVEELAAALLRDAGGDEDAMLARSSAPGRGARAALDLLRQREGFVPAREHVARIAQLRQHDGSGAGLGGLGDEAQAALDIALAFPDMRLHLHAGDAQ